MILLVTLNSDNCTHWYKTVRIQPFRQRPLFHVRNYAFKCFEQYNLTVGTSHLLGRPCDTILDPPVHGFTKYPILSHYFSLVHLNSIVSCSVIYILHSKFSWFTIRPQTPWSFFPFLLPLYYLFVVIYLVSFLWSWVPSLAGWHIFISIYIITRQI